MQKRGNRVCIALIASFLVLFCNAFSFITIQTSAESDVGVVLHYIDVGQGDCTFIELPDGKNMIIDGGIPERGAEVVDYLNKLGVTTIDYMVATHSDSDHIGGLINVLDSFDVKAIVRPFDVCKKLDNIAFEDELYTRFKDDLSYEQVVVSSYYSEFLQKAYDETINGVVSQIYVGTDKLAFTSESAENPYLIKFYMPKATLPFSTERVENGYMVSQVEDKNETSMIVGLHTKNHKFLFCGDATINSENLLLGGLTDTQRDELGDIDVLKVGHHGSSSSTSDDFLALLKPDYAIISVGKNNEYGHPTERVLESLNNASAKIYRTDEDGTIVITEEGDLLSIKAVKGSVVFVWFIIGASIILIVGVVVSSIIFLIIKKKKKLNISNKIK